MMGIKPDPRELFSYVNLEARIPPDHPFASCAGSALVLIGGSALEPALAMGKTRVPGLAERFLVEMGAILRFSGGIMRLRMVLGAVWKNWTEQPLAGGALD